MLYNKRGLKDVGISSSDPASINIIKKYKELSPSLITKNILNNLNSSMSHMIVNILFLVINIACLYFYIQNIFIYFRQNESNIIFKLVIFTILIGILLSGITQYKNAKYINDVNIGERDYYRHLLLLYDIVLQIPPEVYNKNKNKINVYYRVIMNYLHKYIGNTHIINQNNLLLNIIQIYLIILMCLIIYDTIYFLLQSVFADYDINIKIKIDKHIVSTEQINEYNKLYPDSTITIYNDSDIGLTLIGYNNLLKLILDKTQAQNLKMGVMKNMQDKNKRDPDQHGKHIYLSTYTTHDKWNQLILTHIMIKFIRQIQSIESKTSLGDLVNLILSFKLYSTNYISLDQIYLISIGLLFIILIAVIKIYQNNLDLTNIEDNPEIAFNMATFGVLERYNDYFLYKLKQYTYSNHLHIANKIEQEENKLLFFKILIYVILSCILILIILLMIERRISISILILTIYEYELLKHEIFIMITVILFILFMISLKIYIINLCQSMISVSLLECVNFKYGAFVNIAFNFLNNLSVKEQSTFIYKQFNGYVKINNLTTNKNIDIKPLSFTLKPNTINVLYCPAHINITEYLQQIKNKSKNISVGIKNSKNTISLDQLSTSDINNMFQINDELPFVPSLSLEKSIIFNVNPKNISLFNIKYLQNLVPLQKVYENMNAYIVDANINTLSGGEKQRVAILRTLVQVIHKYQYSQCIIFNQSFSGIDKKTTNIIINALKELILFKQIKSNLTILIISNDLEHIKIADNIIYTNDNGDVQIYNNRRIAYNNLSGVI